MFNYQIIFGGTALFLAEGVPELVGSELRGGSAALMKPKIVWFCVLQSL